MKDVEIIGMLKSYVQKSLVGVGALKGAPCKIQSITDGDGFHTVKFEWTDDAGTSHTSDMIVNDGSDIASITQDGATITVELSDGTSHDFIVPTVKGDKGDPGDDGAAGKSAYEIAVEEGYSGTEAEWLASLHGEDGFSPEITVKESTADRYVLTITTKDSEFDTPNLKGGGSGSATNLSDLQDVQLTSLATDQILKWNGSKWVNEDGVEIDNLGDIKDVNLNNLKSGQVLVWDSTTSKWINSDAANPIQFSTMPEAADYPQAVLQYIGADTSTYKRGYFYRSTPTVISGELTYVWQQTNTQPSNSDYESMENKPAINGVELVGDKTSTDLALQGQLQFEVLPEASATLLGKIYQYIGATATNLKKGYWYQCVYDSEGSQYIWQETDVSSNASLAARITANETNIGDMTQLEVSSVSDLVHAINKLNAKAIDHYVYTEPNLIIYYKDGTTWQLSVGDILSETQIGDLQNVIDDTIQDGNVLQYDSALQKYKPYAILTVLTNLLTESKDYTDTKIAEAIVAGAYVCDEKPEYDAENDTVIYKQGGVTKTTTQTDARFYYYSDGDPFCTSWIEDIEFTFSVADVDFEDYVNKNTDVTSTYTEDLLDKSKIPDVAALDALMAIVKTALALKVNTSDIIDTLTSSDATKPLSAKQGKVLKDAVDSKNDTLQYAEMPVAEVAYLGKVAQYVGTTGAAYTKGSFYECKYDNDTATYYWDLIKYSTDIDTQLDASSGNPVANSTLTPELAKKSEQYAVLPAASVDWNGKIVQYTGATSGSLINGYFYKCQLVDGAYAWVQNHTQAQLSAGDGISISNDEINVTNRLEEVTALPTASAALATEGKCYLLKAVQSGYQLGGTYQCQEVAGSDPTEYEWVLISANPLEAGRGITISDNVIDADTNIFRGTMTEWDALSAAEQAKYDFIATEEEDDDITDAITSGDMRPITSNAVAQVVPSDASASNKLVTESNNGCFTFTIAQNETATITLGAAYASLFASLQVQGAGSRMLCLEYNNTSLYGKTIRSGNEYEAERGVSTFTFLNTLTFANSASRQMTITNSSSETETITIMGNVVNVIVS